MSVHLQKKMRMRTFIDNERKETDSVLSHPQLLEAIAKSERELEQGCFIAQQANETISQFLDRITVKPTEK